MAKRTSLSERRSQDQAKGVDAVIPTPEIVANPVEAKPDVTKVTLYIRPDQVEAIESIQLQERKRTGKRRQKSALVQEALDLLIEKYRDVPAGP